jgi:hypothetical protein
MMLRFPSLPSPPTRYGSVLWAISLRVSCFERAGFTYQLRGGFSMADIHAIHEIPWRERSRDACKKAIEDGCIFRLCDIPFDARDEWICGTAMDLQPCQIRDVPWSILTREACEQALGRYSSGDNERSLLRYVPRKFLDRRMCQLSIRGCPESLYDVPTVLLDRQLCEEAVSRDGYAVTYVPGALMDAAMALLAVETTGGALACIPPRYMSQDLVLVAITQDPMAIRYAPDNLLTERSCQVALVHPRAASHVATIWQYLPRSCRRNQKMIELALRCGNGDDGSVLRFVSPSKRSPELCRLAVARWGGAITDVPTSVTDQQPELYTASVRSRGDMDALGRIPPHLLTRWLCEEAARHSGWSLSRTPSEWISEDMALNAIRSGCRGRCGGFPLVMVPEHLRTPGVVGVAVEEFLLSSSNIGTNLWIAALPVDPCHDQLYMLAVRRCSMCYMAIPPEMRSRAMIMHMIQHDPFLCLEHTPSDELVDLDYKMAVLHLPDSIRLIPEERRTPDLLQLAVSMDGLCLRHLSSDETTPELCLSAVRCDKNALRHVPPDMLSRDLYEAMVSCDGGALKLLPEDARSQHLCDIAVSRSPQAVKYVPSSLRSDSMYLVAIQRGLSLCCVPPGDINRGLCAAAVHQSGWELKHVPAQWRTPSMCLRALRFNPGTSAYINKPELEIMRSCARFRAAMPFPCACALPSTLQLHLVLLITVCNLTDPHFFNSIFSSRKTPIQ